MVRIPYFTACERKSKLGRIDLFRVLFSIKPSLPPLKSPSHPPKIGQNRVFRGGAQKRVVTRQTAGGGGEANPPKKRGGYCEKSEYTKQFRSEVVLKKTLFLTLFLVPRYPPSPPWCIPPRDPNLGVSGLREKTFFRIESMFFKSL